ncbi:MAG: hypothetical protein V1839_01040 [archaeon]
MALETILNEYRLMTPETILNEYVLPIAIAAGGGAATLVNYNKTLAAFILMVATGYIACGNKTRDYFKQHPISGRSD